MEDDIRGDAQFLGHAFPKIFEQAVELRVECSDSTALLQRSTGNCLIVEVIVFDNREAFGLLQELLAGRSHLDDSIIVDIFAQVVGDQALFDHGIQHAIILHIFGDAEAFQIIMVMCHHLVGGVAHHYIFNIVIAEVLFRFENGLDDLT